MFFTKKELFFIIFALQFIAIKLTAASSDVKGLSERIKEASQKKFKELNLSRLHLHDISMLDSLLTEQNRNEVQVIDVSYNDLKHVALSSLLNKFPNCRLVMLIHNPLDSLLEVTQDEKASDDMITKKLSEGCFEINTKQTDLINLVYAKGYRVIFDGDSAREIPLTCALFDNESDKVALDFIKIGTKLKELVEAPERTGLLEGMEHFDQKVIMVPISCIR